MIVEIVAEFVVEEEMGVVVVEVRTVEVVEDACPEPETSAELFVVVTVDCVEIFD